MRRIETVEVRWQHQDQASGKLSPEPGLVWAGGHQHQLGASWDSLASCLMLLTAASPDGSLLSWARPLIGEIENAMVLSNDGQR